MKRYKWLGLLALMPATAMVFADQGILAVALPTLGIYFGASESQLWWCINAYLIVSALFLLFGGRIGERVGYRKAFVWGLAIFVVASILCSVSVKIGWLIAARALQGIGTALIIPASYPLIMSLFPSDERGKAVGINMSMSSLFWMLSPLIGGFIVQNLSWQWLFGINLPIGLVALLLIFRFIRRSPVRDPNREYPLIDFSLFRLPIYRAVNISLFVSQFILISTIYRAIFFQDTLGWTPLKSGTVLVISSLPVLIAPPLSGWIADRFGTKLPISLGYLCLILSLFWVVCSIQEPLELLFIGLIGMTIGISFIFTPSYTAVMGIVAPNRAGTAFAMLATLRARAATLGVVATSAFVTYEQMETFHALVRENHLEKRYISNLKAMLVSQPEISTRVAKSEFRTFRIVHLAMGVIATVAFALVLRATRKTEEPKGMV